MWTLSILSFVFFFHLKFIVVSLKEGMFNNANVLFKTKFVDGVSTVTRFTQSQNEKIPKEKKSKAKGPKWPHVEVTDVLLQLLFWSTNLQLGIECVKNEFCYLTYIFISITYHNEHRLFFLISVTMVQLPW